jgi:23S rRNA (cytosine1962-C5)-methyltransferase
MEQIKTDILLVLADVLHPAGILLRNDTASRTQEGLDSYTEVIGAIPDRVRLTEHGAHFDIPLQTGQKTGWFYDHRPNRRRLRHYIQNKRVLDVFSYLGAWGIAAAVNGATTVTCVETSESACTEIARHAEINNVAHRVNVRHGDAFTVLKELQTELQKFDVVVLDPPAFIKRKKDLKEGLIAYQRINQTAMQLLDKPGLLVSASCSSHINAEVFLDTLRRAARSTHNDLQILERGGQGPDHPIHPAIPETDYLKCYFARVLEE